jgi:hypothetical protein
MAKKQILLNAFNMNCVGHINHGLWTHPRDNSVDYNTLSTGPSWPKRWSAACSTACSSPTSSVSTMCTSSR